jgi:hypothetical protein
VRENLSEISENTIFHGIEHKNPSFEKMLVQKLIGILSFYRKGEEEANRVS